MSDRLTEEMLRASREQLKDRFDSGRPVPSSELAGYGFRGISLGLPSWVDRLLWKTFAKVFVEEAGRVRGFNLRIVQRGFDGPYWQKRLHPRFGEFEVRDGATAVLDYAGRKRSPLPVLRDTVVAIHEDPLTLLGRAHVHVGGLCLDTPSYFLLTRAAPVPAHARLKNAHEFMSAI